MIMDKILSFSKLTSTARSRNARQMRSDVAGIGTSVMPSGAREISTLVDIKLTIYSFGDHYHDSRAHRLCRGLIKSVLYQEF